MVAETSGWTVVIGPDRVSPDEISPRRDGRGKIDKKFNFRILRGLDTFKERERASLAVTRGVSKDPTGLTTHSSEQAPALNVSQRVRPTR